MLDESVFREAKLCVVGNINRDIKTAPFRPGDFLFRDGETSIAAIHETIGGGGANSAAMAARLGAQVAFMGQVGDDALGRHLEEAMTGSGVRCYLHKTPGVATGTTVNLVFNSGQRHFLSCHPNNAALAFESLDLEALGGARHLLRADIWFSEAMLYGGNEKLLRAAREAGLAISIDLNWDPQWGHAPPAEITRRKEAVRAVLPLVDLAHGNVRELTEFADAENLGGALEKLRACGVGAVVVHMGKEGAGYFCGDQLLIVKPPGLVTRPAIATGTGDVLSVCMMLMHHRTDVPTEEKLHLANCIVAEFIEGQRQLIPTL
jgi:sugar/nucleoside kinase (ribokinase family)